MNNSSEAPVPSLSAIEPFALIIRRNVEEVNLVLSVTDRKGRFVQGLEPSDLTIFDNDTQQKALTFFQSQTDLPLHVAIVLDISASIAARFAAEQGTIDAFLRRSTRSRDSVELFAFNQRVQFTAPVANNWRQISKRVRKLKPDGETALFDAVCTASQWLARDPEPSRRVLILISDGEENKSQTDLNQAIAEVLRAEATLYAVNVQDLPVDREELDGVAIMKQLSDATGGAYLKAGENGDVGHAFEKIRRELRSQYALAYKPTNLAEQLFHHLRVVTSARNLRVRCRTGYYAK